MPATGAYTRLDNHREFAMNHLNLDQLNALNRFAAAYGRPWKSVLHAVWLESVKPLHVPSEDLPLLRQVRNIGGPEFLQRYKANDKPWAAIGFILKDRQERFTLKRGWFVNAWRLVDAKQQDMVQPWFNSKRDLREYASTANIYLIEA